MLQRKGHNADKMSGMKAILLLEDDEGLNRGITITLQKEGYKVYSAYSIEEAESIFRAETLDMIISDITLPDGSGLEFGRRVRAQSDICFLYLTAMDSETDIINGYNSGADDYVTKPFSLMVLTSKVNALMRRMGENNSLLLIADDLKVNVKEARVFKGGQEIMLSKTELQLLIYFLENAGQILSKEMILEKVWGNDGRFVDDNTVAVNISRLKNKLETDSVSNVRGLGYLWTGQVRKK